MNQETRKGGLGRGLAALIPSGPSNGSPRLGDGAADVILGGTKGAKGARGTDAERVPGAPKPGLPGTGPTPETVKESAKEPGKSKPKKKQRQAAEKGPEKGADHGGVDTPAAVEFGATYREIPLGDIVPNPQQPRTTFDEEPLEELVHSIREFGLMQPIVVRRSPTGTGFELIMGERRWRASAKAGLESIPAIVRETEDGAMLRDALLENIHRVQLNPLEEASAYQQLLEEFGVTQGELADRIGRSRPVITNALRLLALPVPVQRRVAANVLTAGHARALAGVKLGEDTAAAQEQLADRVVAEGMSVRATEEAVTLLNRSGLPEAKKPTAPAPQAEVFTRAADRLADEWDTRVTVTMGRRKGRMVVEFGDEEDFQRILGLIEGRD